MKKHLLLGLLLFNPSFVKADTGYCGFGMMGFGNWGYFGMALGVIFWTVILYLIYLLIKRLSDGNLTSLEIVKKRYGKGDITKKEYEKMRKELNG